MPEAIGTQHDEHVHFWSEPPQTLQRLAALLKNDDDYKTAFAESSERPERSQDDGEYHRKFRALVRTYLDAHVQKVSDPRRQKDIVDALSETHVAQPLVSAAREIMGLDGGDDISGVSPVSTSCRMRITIRPNSS